MDQYLIFQLNNQKFALPISLIIKVVHVVTIHPVAKSSTHVLGTIDFQGIALSVVNFRAILGLPAKEIELSDILLICHLNDARFALLIDRVENTEYCEDQPCEKAPDVPLPESLDKFIKVQSETVPVYKLDKILSQTNLQPSEEAKNVTPNT